MPAVLFLCASIELNTRVRILKHAAVPYIVKFLQTLAVRMPSKRWYLIADTSTKPTSLVLYDQADGQPMKMNRDGLDNDLGYITDVHLASDSKQDVIKQKNEEVQSRGRNYLGGERW